MVKNLPVNAGDTGLIPGLGRSFGIGNGNPLQYSCWKLPWTEELGGLQSVGSQRVGHNCATSLSFFLFYCESLKLHGVCVYPRSL